MSRRSGRSKPSADDRSRASDAEDNDMDIEDGDEITRCVCGHDELTSIDSHVQQLLQQEYRIKVDSGLFIQCDKCSVWQHGYCVGLFVNEDVPDKYWCEQCKPELHMVISVLPKQPGRTLYKPANEERPRLMDEESSRSEKRAATRSRGRRSPSEKTPEASRETDRQSRKDRRHGNDFDEQLQKALRESAKASGRNDNKRQSDDSEHTGGEKRSHSETSENEVDESNADEESEATQKEARARASRPKPKSRPASAKPKTSAPKTEKTAINKEELLSQSSKPRFVNDKCTIYELRKRTGAILEWLGRTQMELEEEKDLKKDQLAEANSEQPFVSHFDENLRLMENLTEKILSWEQKFGKYAP